MRLKQKIYRGEVTLFSKKRFIDLVESFIDDAEGAKVNQIDLQKLRQEMDRIRHT